MSGIDKIIQQIETDTKEVCDSVIASAQQKADGILAKAEKEVQMISEESKEKTAAHVVDIKKRGDSAADLEERKIVLYTKQNIISDMLKEGLNTAKALPDDEYFSLISQMVKKYSMPRDGVILFGKKDLKRLPEGFVDTLNAEAEGSLTLSDDVADIDAGFILKYGGIEQNCSFDAIFAGEAENLSDRAGRLLF